MQKISKKLTIKIITLFPKFIEDFVESFGIVRKAVKNRLLEIKPIYLRKFGLDKRGTVDGRPYGGGVGMVLRADVLLKAIRAANSKFNPPRRTKKSKIRNQKSKIILLTPQGKTFNQKTAQRLAKYDELILVCGRYEGFDERIRRFVDEELSIGDYVLMGGELPALVITEAVMRLRSGILGKDESSVAESFSSVIPKIHGREKQEWLQLEYPQYTKPEVLRVSAKGGSAFGGKSEKLKVPKVLLSGNHRNIEEWRREEAIKRTKSRRPDLF